MKPMSPEDHELEKMSSEVSERYHAGSQDEPPAPVDAAIVAAARREVDQTRQRRSWPMAASVAAVLVIGISLILLMRNNEPPLSLDRPAEEGKLARPAPPQLAMNTQPKARENYRREDRPSRERTARPEREPSKKQEAAAVHDAADAVATSQSGSAPAAPAIPGQSKPSEQEQLRSVEPSEVPLAKRSKAASAAGVEPSPGAQAMRKEDLAAGNMQPQDWLRKIEDLLRDGKSAAAREQLIGFRRQFPSYSLPPQLQELLPADQR